MITLSTMWTAAWLKLKFWLDFVYTVAALFCVPAAIGSCLVWGFGYGHTAYVAARTSMYVQAQAGSTSEIDTDLDVQSDSQKFTYSLRLVDSNGQTAYTYPESDVLTSMPNMSKIVIQVPADIKSGSYGLYTDVTYAKNPLRTGTVSTKIARIEIE